MTAAEKTRLRKQTQAAILSHIRQLIRQYNADSERLRAAGCYDRKILMLSGWKTTGPDHQEDNEGIYVF